MEKKVSRTNLRKKITDKQLKATILLSMLWMGFHMLTAAQIIFLTPHKLRIIHLGFALIMVFLLTPFGRKSDMTKFGGMDVLLALSAAVAFIIAFFRYDALLQMGGRYDMIDIYIGIICIILLFEAARRVSSPGLIGLALVALTYVFFGQYLSGGLSHTGFTLKRVVQHLFLTGEGVFGFALGVSAETIVVFVIFGALLQEVGIADYFYDLSNALAGRAIGGPAKVAVISSSLMGMISGETSANVATTGAFTIPLMKRVGYSPDFAGAVECAASAGGQILPPVMGATAFMLADTLGIPYIDLAIAAMLPALLYYTSVFSGVHFRAVRLNLRRNDEDTKGAKDLLKKSYLMLPLAGIVVFLLMNYTPTFAAFWGGIGTAVVISFFNKETRLSPEKITRIMYNSARTAMSLAVATAVVGIIVGVFSLTGISMTMARLIFKAAGGIKIITLFLTMIVAIILGMGLPTSAAYVLASISAAPALTLAGIDLLPAHLFVFYYGCMSTITPPVATGAYTAAGLSGGNANTTGFIALRLAVAGFIVPFVFIYIPDLLLGPSINLLKTLFGFVVTFIGIVYLCSALEGAFLDMISASKRVIFAITGILLILPHVQISLFGMILAVGLFFYEYRKLKNSAFAINK